MKHTAQDYGRSVSELDRADVECQKAADELIKYGYADQRYKDQRNAVLAAERLKIRKANPEYSEAKLSALAEESEAYQGWLVFALRDLKKAGAARLNYSEKVRKWEHERQKIWTAEKELKRYGG